MGFIADIIGASANSKAIKQATQAATTAADNNNLLARENRDLNVANFTPDMTRGNQAGDTLSAFLGLGGDQNASNTALQTFLKNTGYQFGRDQGISAITGNAATRGLLNSGSTVKALDKFGTDYAQSAGVNPFLERLTQLSQQGVQAKSAIAGVGQNFVTQTSQNNDSSATNTGNAAIAGAKNTTNLLGQIVGSLNQAAGASSYGGGF